MTEPTPEIVKISAYGVGDTAMIECSMCGPVGAITVPEDEDEDHVVRTASFAHLASHGCTNLRTPEGQ